MDLPEESSVDLSGMSRETLEDAMVGTQGMLQELLEMLGQAWEEIERLKRELQPQTAQMPVAEAVETTPAPLHGVLIVDDSKVLQLRMKSILQSLNFDIVGIAEDGAEGVRMALTKLPKLVILDYQMPVVDGLAALKAIKHAHPEIKVLICAGTITAASGKQFMLAGADQIIAKPIQLNSFIAVVRGFML